MNDPCRLGLLALGDSITNGDGEPALGVPCRSWALWLAQALELPYTNLARDGAVVADVLAEQVPRVRGAFNLGCLYIGVNDVRRLDFDAPRFAADLAAALARLAEHADRLLTFTIPLDLGRPRAGAKVGTANAVIRRLAGEHGAACAALDDLCGTRLLLPDAVHLTAVGQLELADRAARALGHPRLPSRDARPASPLARARFARRWGAMLACDLVRRAVERVRPPR